MHKRIATILIMTNSIVGRGQILNCLQGLAFRANSFKEFLNIVWSVNGVFFKADDFLNWCVASGYLDECLEKFERTATLCWWENKIGTALLFYIQNDTHRLQLRIYLNKQVFQVPPRRIEKGMPLIRLLWWLWFPRSRLIDTESETYNRLLLLLLIGLYKNPQII